MNILITHQFNLVHGGSYIYTQEIANVLKENNNLVVINGNNIEHNFDLNIESLNDVKNINFDLIIIMQAGHFKNLDIKIGNARIINIIHSEVYDCDHPLINNRVKYIAVRQEIKDYLINNFNIAPEKITILINPINKKFYEISNQELDEFYEKKFGIFACSSFGQVRHKAIIDFAIFCKDLNYKSLLIAPLDQRLKNTLENIYDKIIEPCDDINKYIQKAQISGGIQKGRTYWEAKLCGKATIEYIVNSNGDILDEIHEPRPSEKELNEIKKITDPQYITKKIIDISKVFDRYILDEYFDAIYDMEDKYNFLNTNKINPIKINDYLNNNLMSQTEMETLINYNQILLHAETNKYEQILIIQNHSEIHSDINKIFYNKYNLFKSDWEIIIFSNDFSGVALKEKAYLELKKCIDLKLSLDRCITKLIQEYKTYIFKDRLIKYKNPDH